MDGTGDWSAEQRQALEAFLRKAGVGEGSLVLRRIGEGHSNLTYLADDGARRAVVRRPPPPPLPPGAHDVLREAQLLRALAGTAVPVPAVLATAEAGEVLDVPLYVMGHVPGPVVTDRTPSPLDVPEQRRRIGEDVVDTLAALHCLDVADLGLTGFGRPEGFNARHLRRLLPLVSDAAGAPPPAFAELNSWLTSHVPAESAATVVHGDYRLGNLILAPDRPGRVAAVLDWELATLGDPLWDVAYLLAGWPVPGEPLTPTQGFATALLEPGYPTRDEAAARYASRTGRDLTALPWYTAAVFWKLAVLYEYSRRRALTGTGDTYYLTPGLVEAFLDAGHRAAGLPSASRVP